MSTIKTTQSSRKHHAPRCTFISSSGRRCRLSSIPAQPGARDRNLYCTFHAKRDLHAYNVKSVSEEILGQVHDLRSEAGIHQVLSKLFTATVEDRIPVRNARILAYIATLMLRTLKPLREELIASGWQPPSDASQLPSQSLDHSNSKESEAKLRSLFGGKKMSN
jgi:hypothetical protein